MSRLELLQLDSPEVRDDLLLSELAIALRSLGRKLMRVVKPFTGYSATVTLDGSIKVPLCASFSNRASSLSAS